MSMVYDVLKQLQDRLERLEAWKLEVERGSHSTNSTPSRSIQEDVLEMIKSHWVRNQEPIPQRFISQSFAKRASRQGGIRLILETLDRDGSIKLLRIYTGAVLVFPASVYKTLSSRSIDDLVYAGVSAPQRERIQARGRVSLNAAMDRMDGPTAEQLAASNAEAMKAFGLVPESESPKEGDES